MDLTCLCSCIFSTDVPVVDYTCIAYAIVTCPSSNCPAGTLDGFEISVFIFSFQAVALFVLTVISSFLGMSECKLWTMVKNL
jgi:hypothetical protein